MILKKEWMTGSKDNKVPSESIDDSGSSSEIDEDEEEMLLREGINKLAEKLEKLDARKKETKGKGRKKRSMDRLTKADSTNIRKT